MTAMCNSFISFLLLFAVFSLVSGTTKDYFDAKFRLMKYLTNNSELMKEILPAQDINTPVNVNVKIYLRQITNVDEKHQAIRLTVWLRFNWNNPFLTWDPAEYGGIKNVHANHELFWVPDVALFNEATLKESTDILYKRLDTKLIIDRYGDCWWNVPTTLLSQCKIDVSHFPFDEQECNISIGSWTYSSQKINLTYFEQNADLTNFIKNGEWNVERALLYNILRRYNYYGEELPYKDVTLTLKIKRRTTYYWVNIILPSTIIFMLSLLSFCLPSDNGQRIKLVISVLLALSVYMLIASSFLPDTSNAVPYLVKYYLGIFATLALCLCATCVTLKMRSFKSPMGHLHRSILRKLGNCPCFPCFKFLKKSFPPDDATTIKNGKDDYESHKTTSTNQQQGQELNEVSSQEGETRPSENILLGEIRLLIEELQSKNRVNNEEKLAIIEEWKRAATLLDRVFFCVFSLAYIAWVLFLVIVNAL